MPKPLFTKLVAQVAIGFFCVLFGSIYALHTKDRIFLIMSLLIGLCCLIRSMSLFRLIHTHSYRVLTGVCTKRDQGLFQKKQQIVFTTCNQKEYHFTFDKNVKILQGHNYHLYFQISNSLEQNQNSNEPSSQSYLGAEEISMVE